MLLITSIFLLFVQAQAAELSNVDQIADQLRAPLPSLTRVSEEPEFQFFKTKSEYWLIGLRQLFRVHASVERVAAVLDDIKAYPGIFSDLKKAEYTDFKSIDDYTLFTETNVSFPFVPNDRTEMIYRVQRKPETVLYRYNLKKSNTMKRFDGLIYLQSLPGAETLFFEYDSFEPDLGLAKMVGQEKIWVEGAIDNLQSDWAVKLRAEHADWSSEKVLQESESKLKGARSRLRNLYELRESFDLTKIVPSPTAPKEIITEKNPSSPKN